MQPKKSIRKKTNNNTVFVVVATTLLLVTSLISGFMIRFKQAKEKGYNQDTFSNCQNLERELKKGNIDNIDIKDKGLLKPNDSLPLRGTVNDSNTHKYRFTPKEDRKLKYKTKNSVKICIYNDQDNLVNSNRLSKSTEYSLFIITDKSKEDYYVNFETTALSKENSSVSSNAVEEDTKEIEDLNSTTESNQTNQADKITSSIDVSYNVKDQPHLQKNSQRLQKIVNNIINLSMAKKLPVRDISITLIDVNNKTIAQYQGNQPRYPASITKLFWVVMLYSYIEEGKINVNNNLSDQIDKMMSKSDNEAASYIIDLITDTESGAIRSKDQFKTWRSKRMQLNIFFNKANYSNLNISQKTYPIPYLEDYGKRPKGRELAMRHLGDRNENNPIRNKLTTQHAARLMYEVVTEKAVSPDYSQKIQDHLERNLDPKAWKNIDPNFEFNPVLAFFGQGLPTEVRFLSKAGWTSNTRQEVAYIETPDQETRYILAIFAEDKGYAQNWEIFPQLSESVFKQMTN